jgi:elongation factor Ts
MSQVSAKDVMKLRDRTDMPMMDCKTALTEAAGDIEKAVGILKAKGQKFIDKKGDRETAEGRIGTFVDDLAKIGGIVELRCESPSVVKNDRFIKLANDIAKQVAVKNPATVDELMAQPFVDDPSQAIKDRIAEVVGLIRENMKVARFARTTGPSGEYVHHDGSVGVLFAAQGEKTDRQLLRDVCMHITAVVPTPAATRREDVAADVIAKEKEAIKAQMAIDPKNVGKPANILEKIAEGKLNSWYKDNVLVEQPFVKDDSKTVGQVLKAGGFEAVRFVRFKIGEKS